MGEKKDVTGPFATILQCGEIKMVVLEHTAGRIGRAGSPTSVEPKQNHGGRKDFGAAKGCRLTVDLGTYTGMDAGMGKLAG